MGILFTFIVGIAGLVNGLVTTKRTLYVNAVTSERVKWMGDLKEFLAEYLSKTTLYEQKKLLEGDELNTYLERLIYLRNRIKLHLNPIDEKDKNIIRLIDKINDKIIMIYDYREIEKTEKDFGEKYDKILKLLSGKLMSPVETKYIAAKMSDRSRNGINENVIKLIAFEVNRVDMILKNELGRTGEQMLLKWSKDLTDLSSDYLKEEWERVKLESQNGHPSQNQISRNKKGTIISIIVVYILAGFLLNDYFSEASKTSKFIILFIVVYTSFFPFLKQVLKELEFNKEIRYVCLVLMEVSLWLSSLAVISSLLMLSEKLTIAEVALYICIPILLSLRNILKILQ